jgi:hypothetical protein
VDDGAVCGGGDRRQWHRGINAGGVSRFYAAKGR